MDDRGFGLEFDFECEEIVDLLFENEFFDSFLYGVILLRNIRRCKEKLRREKDKVIFFFKSFVICLYGFNFLERIELDRWKKWGFI